MGDVVERLTLEEVVQRAESEFYREPTRAAHSLPAHIANAVRSFLMSEEVVDAMCKAHCDHFGGTGWWETGLLKDTLPEARKAMRAALSSIAHETAASP